MRAERYAEVTSSKGAWAGLASRAGMPNGSGLRTIALVILTIAMVSAVSLVVAARWDSSHSWQATGLIDWLMPRVP